MKHRYFITCLLFLINTILQGGRSITKEDIVNLQYVLSPTMSPDGDNIAYVLSVPREDDEISVALRQQFVREGINIHTDTTCKTIITEKNIL